MKALDMSAEMRAYQETLRGFAETLEIHCGGTWGIAGLREESLVFLFGETMDKQEGRWSSIEYETSYPDRRRRCDIVATALNGDQLWIEAKWWWRGNELAPVLEQDGEKLSHAPAGAFTAALVFTVDEKGVEGDGHRWDASGAEKWMASIPGKEGLDQYWRHIQTVTAPSRYKGTSYTEQGSANVKCRSGLFAASIYQYVRG